MCQHDFMEAAILDIQWHCSVHLCCESTLYLLLYFCACSWDVLLAEACKQPCSKPAQVKVCVAKDKTLCGLILGPSVDLLTEGCGESGDMDSAFIYVSSEPSNFSTNYRLTHLLYWHACYVYLTAQRDMCFDRFSLCRCGFSIGQRTYMEWRMTT